MFLEKVIFKNIAPFGDLNLNFEDKQVIVFSGINGKGKTTILSYIADAFFELSKQARYQDVLVKDGAYFRVHSPLSPLIRGRPALVYLRFRTIDGNVDYIEKHGNFDFQGYSDTVHLSDKVPFSQFEKISKDIVNVSEEKAREYFKNNVLIYFPSDRRETPGWLNSAKIREHQYSTQTRINHTLRKNIEVVSVGTEISNWILDVALDYHINSIRLSAFLNGKEVDFPRYTPTPIGQRSAALWNSLNQICQAVLSEKGSNLKFGVGNRFAPQHRISIFDDGEEKNDDGVEKKTIVPSLEFLSSGESALLFLFLEIVKNFDHKLAAGPDYSLEKITGIVVIDEVDKHLHIKLQKEVLPNLINLFPNLQFILSSHSPFFAIGASKTFEERVRFIDVGLQGQDIPLSKVNELEELYNEILGENENYKKAYDEIQEILKDNLHS